MALSFKLVPVPGCMLQYVKGTLSTMVKIEGKDGGLCYLPVEHYKSYAVLTDKDKEYKEAHAIVEGACAVDRGFRGVKANGKENY